MEVSGLEFRVQDLRLRFQIRGSGFRVGSDGAADLVLCEPVALPVPAPTNFAC